MNIFGYIEIKARIVDKDDDIGLPLVYVLLTHLHILENSTKVQQHWNKAHIRQLAIVANTRAPNSSHQVATEETEVSLAVALLQSLHQMRGM